MAIGLFIAAILLIAVFWREIVPGTIERSMVTSPANRLSLRRDMVGEASMDSFPCSDPPPWTLGIEAGDGRRVAPTGQGAGKGS